MHMLTPMVTPLQKLVCFLLLAATFAIDAPTAVALAEVSTEFDAINVSIAEVRIKAEGEGVAEGAQDTERPTATLKAGYSSTVTGPVTVTLTLS